MTILPKKVERDGGNTIVTIQCMFCLYDKRVWMTHEEYANRYVHGQMIQEALPNHSADDRELLTSKMCGKCFDKAFGFQKSHDSFHFTPKKKSND